MVVDPKAVLSHTEGGHLHDGGVGIGIAAGPPALCTAA